jgi:hypothetical protein
MFRVIEGGLGGATIVKGPADAEDVRREAARRLRVAGYDDAATRSFVTGRPLPDGLKYLKLQMEFSAAALAKLSPVPADFRDDRYWPTL